MSRLHGQLKMAVFDRPFAAKIHHGISLMLPKAVKEGKFRVSFEKSLGISDGKKRSLRTRPLIEPLRVMRWPLPVLLKSQRGIAPLENFGGAS